jgi:subtilisin family serine protease
MRPLLILFIITIAACRANTSSAKDSSSVKPANEVWVMIIDTGIGRHDKLTNVEYINSDDYVDNHGHGTHVAGIVEYGNKLGLGPTKDFSDKLCTNVKLFSCKYFDPKRLLQNNLQSAVECVNKATELKMDYINYSGGGSDFSEAEYLAYRRFTESGGTAVVAAGNEHSDLSNRPYYPASYSSNDGFTMWKRSLRHKNGSRRYVPIRLQVIQNTNPDDTLATTSNRHVFASSQVGMNITSTFPNNSYGIMSGTSQAAPAALHIILKHECVQINGKK